VRTGAEPDLTPVGAFRVVNRSVEPQWTFQGRVVPGGHPDNELGARWMGFEGNRIGIHEAIDPTTIGTYSSNGCVGMVRQDVVELYDLTRLGTPVTIVEYASEYTPVD
jgi:lipoprotein-anchoring transpeptidase ErfK/SrfK